MKKRIENHCPLCDAKHPARKARSLERKLWTLQKLADVAYEGLVSVAAERDRWLARMLKIEERNDRARDVLEGKV